ncbi:MAG: flagella basal body P-ring formation protein FlgA [Gallionellales bacterium 35-53-114]|jgi:flagella basal body P-ring formation protein FlgA|nr:MAG: flagella basal body P-ring formation protein FlgA [Gallionellales bacterium 35-53-114]OYZ64232.1 MAG: flagella basal body P-ring formation protein FlgA [Gallionellales bacterium 24-53-125]OZB10459.1 MAG: flagella basal body P-ring formation protein FlgA [Gallionellales bacterium 39-52-133]HQS57075.1 flagellar basal body P-ring formation chaperone FlgA [Gallionellaceae bacterium]HQS74737.1 flagellar basal body P-ring formation chaperone FlgA [Gallionellaceae bacterium]
MHKYPFLLLSLIMLSALPAAAGAAPAAANAVQSHSVIRDTVAAFVRAQTKAIPGKVSIQVTDIDRRIVLPACPALEAFLPPGSQLNGNSNVGVRCNSKQPWSLFVQVNVKISLNMLTAGKTLQQGQTIRAEDLGTLSSESLQPGTLTDPAQAIGKIMKIGIAAGQILRHDMLRAPYSVRQGQSVQLNVVGSGFRVSAEGRALNNAAEGETTSARTTSGQIVSGVVKAGAIEIIQ